MNQQILNIFLGGLLAMLGGIVAQRFQGSLDRKKEEENLLYQALMIISEYAFFEAEESKCRLELAKVLIRIKSKKYLALAKKISIFLTNNDFDNETQRDSLMAELRLVINKRLEKEMTKEIEESKS